MVQIKIFSPNKDRSVNVHVANVSDENYFESKRMLL
jgi:hypothetical protein